MPLTDSDYAATYKILILGDSTVGKSSLLRSLVGKEFMCKTLPTVGLDFVQRTFEVDGAVVKLHVWDTAGQQRFHSVTRKHYNGVQGIILVYDITDRKSFSHLSFWVDSINKGIAHSKNKYDSVPVILVGNKMDLDDDRDIKEDEGKELALKIMAFDFIETSAKGNENVIMVFKRLAQFVTETFDPKVMKSYHPYMLRPPEIMEEKRKQNDKSKQKKRKRKKKGQNNTKDNKVTSNDLYNIESAIYSTDSEKEKNDKKKARKRRFLLTKTKRKVQRAKDRHKKKKKKNSLGFIWRKLFRRKRTHKESHKHSIEHSERHRSCVIL